MEALSIILLLAAAATPVALLVGMISPRLVLRSASPTRGKVVKVYVPAFFMFSVAGVVAFTQTDAYKAQLAAQEAEKARLAAEAEPEQTQVEAEAEAVAEVAEVAVQEGEAKRQVEEEDPCRMDLQCWGDKHAIDATIACEDLVERLALNSFEWTDGWLEPKFSHFRWQNRERGVVTYIGDKIRYQNGFGAMINHVYECDFDPESGAVLDVRAHQGRL